MFSRSHNRRNADAGEKYTAMKDRWAWLKGFAADMQGTQKLATKNNIPLLSAAVSFLTLFACCPLFILSFMASQSLLNGLNSPESLGELRKVIDTLIPNASPIIAQNIIDLMQKSTLFNVMGILMLIYSTYELFEGLHIIFQKISTRGTERNFWWSQAIAVGSFLLVFNSSCAFIILTTVPEATLQTLVHLYFPDREFPALRPLATTLSLLIVVGSITLIYKWMPTQKVRLWYAFRGSLLFIGLFLVGRVCYEVYVTFYRQYNVSVYGTFLSLFVVLIWIYYLSRIFLFAAQYAIYLEEKDFED